MADDDIDDLVDYLAFKDDIDKPIYYIDKQLNEANMPIDQVFLEFHKIKETFYQHDKWPEIAAKNKQVMAEQSKIYLDLVANDPNISAVNSVDGE